jgi:hypothetical protein
MSSLAAVARSLKYQYSPNDDQVWLKAALLCNDLSTRRCVRLLAGDL